MPNQHNNSSKKTLPSKKPIPMPPVKKPKGAIALRINNLQFKTHRPPQKAGIINSVNLKLI